MRWFAFGEKYTSLSFAGLCQASNEQEAARMVRQYERLWGLTSGENRVLDYTAEQCAAERERRQEVNT